MLWRFFLVWVYLFVFVQEFSFAGPKLPFFVPSFIESYLDSSFYLLPEVNGSRLIRARTEGSIHRELNHSLGGGGKRVRPLLVFLAGGLVGLSPREILNFARLAEFTHVASLIHDDVIDEDNFRRGKPTIRNEFGNARAVLFGDYLFSEAIKRSLSNPKIAFQLLEVIQGMTTGEEIQAAAVARGSFGIKTYREIILHKTGLIFEWAMVSPLELLNRKPKFLEERFSAFALALGELYQRWDDLDPTDYSKNEVNIVRYHAARVNGVSPISEKLTKAQLKIGEVKAAQELQRLGRWVKDELLRSMVEGSTSQLKSRYFVNRHVQCAQSLTELVDFLSVSRVEH